PERHRQLLSRADGSEYRVGAGTRGVLRQCPTAVASGECSGDSTVLSGRGPRGIAGCGVGSLQRICRGMGADFDCTVIAGMLAAVSVAGESAASSMVLPSITVAPAAGAGPGGVAAVDSRTLAVAHGGL